MPRVKKSNADSAKLNPPKTRGKGSNPNSHNIPPKPRVGDRPLVPTPVAVKLHEDVLAALKKIDKEHRPNFLRQAIENALREAGLLDAAEGDRALPLEHDAASPRKNRK